MDTRWPSARIFAFARGRWRAAHLLAFPPVSVWLPQTLLEVMALEQPEAMAIAFDLGLPPSATKPTTPIKQTARHTGRLRSRSKKFARG